MTTKFFYVFNSCRYWYSKFMEVCFCVTYPLSDDEEDFFNKTPDSSVTPYSIPDTAIMERNKEKFLYGRPDENL